MPIATDQKSSFAFRMASRQIQNKSGRIAQLLAPGFKTEPIDPNKFAEQLKETELNRRQASFLINYHLNQSRDLLDRLHYLLYLCNTQKTIETPPPR